MSTELTPTEQKQGICPVDPPMSDMCRLIETAITTSDFDVKAFQMLLEQKRIEEDRGAERAFLKAKALFQRDCLEIKHDRTARTDKGMVWTYASLGWIESTVKPYCGKHGLSYRWTERDGRLVCVLSHRDGHHEESSFTLSTEGQKGAVSYMTKQQQEGATDTYARGRTLTAVLGIGTAQMDMGGAEPEPEPNAVEDTRASGIKREWFKFRHELEGKDQAELTRRFGAWFLDNTDAKVFTPVMTAWTLEQLAQCRAQLDKEAAARSSAATQEPYLGSIPEEEEDTINDK